MAKPHPVTYRKINESQIKRDKAGYKKRNYEGLDLLTKEIRAITQPILGARGFAGVDIIEAWTDIVGAELSMGIRPEKLTFERDKRTNGTLHVKSAGGAFAIIFEHQKQQVIERINTFFGYPAVSRIQITQGKLYFPKRPIEKIKKKPTSKQLKELEEKVAHIEDENLKNAMYEMGLAFLQNK